MVTEPEDGEFELVMPFVVCATNGGPYDDDAFVAGYELGALDNHLQHVRPEHHDIEVRKLSVPQADLIAMRHGYTANPVEGDDEWEHIHLHRTPDEHASADSGAGAVEITRDEHDWIHITFQQTSGAKDGAATEVALSLHNARIFLRSLLEVIA